MHLLIFPQEDTLPPYIFGSQTIDVLLATLPVRKVVPPTLQLVALYFQPSMHFRMRRAAITALTNLSDGCAEAVKDILGM